MHIRCGLPVSSKAKRRRWRAQSKPPRTCITSAVRLALLFPMLQTIDQTWAIVMPGIWMQVFPESRNLILIISHILTYILSAVSSKPTSSSSQAACQQCVFSSGTSHRVLSASLRFAVGAESKVVQDMGVAHITNWSSRPSDRQL